MQQTIPSRFRDSSHGSIQGPNDKRSTVAFSPSDHLDSIFQAVRQQVSIIHNYNYVLCCGVHSHYLL